MFAASLRRRSSFAPGIQSLQSALGLRENHLITHDLEVTFNSTTDPRSGNTSAARRLRVLLLAPSAVAEERLIGTFERIAHFASLTGGEAVVIVFLLHPPKISSFTSATSLAKDTKDDSIKFGGVYAYSKLQAEVMNHEEIPHIPILPLNSLDALPALLKKHIANLSRPCIPQKPTATSFELLQLCTANPPMAQQTAFILSDLFTDLRDLATTCTEVLLVPGSSSPSARAAASQSSAAWDTSNGVDNEGSGISATDKLKRLRDLVGDQACCDIVDFWKEEWLID